MKQITLTVSSRDYTITLDDDFAEIFERDWQKFMKGKKFIEPRELINAFVEKSYESYTNFACHRGRDKRYRRKAKTGK